MCDQNMLNYGVEFDFMRPNDVSAPQQLGFGIRAKRTKRTEMLSQQIANTDDLVQQLRKSMDEHQVAEQQLRELKQSAQAISELYEQEKNLRIDFEKKFKSMQENFVELEEENMRKTIECDNYKDMCAQFEGAVDYNDLVVSYIRLYEICDQGQLMRKDKEIVATLRKYSEKYQLKIKPAKEKRRKLKRDVAVQCDETAVAKEKPSVLTNDVGTQYISTVATRGTNTHDLIGRRDFGHVFPPTPSANAIQQLDFMLNELLEYDVSSYIVPISPLTALDDEKIQTRSIGTETTSRPLVVETKCVATETICFTPAIVTKSVGTCTYSSAKKSIGTDARVVEMNSRETCTYLCNLERNIGYIPSMQTAIDAINDLNATQMQARHHDVYQESANESAMFNKLWGIFGCMVSGLIQNKQLTASDNGGISSVLPKSVFSSWYQTACATDKPTKVMPSKDLFGDKQQIDEMKHFAPKNNSNMSTCLKSPSTSKSKSPSKDFHNLFGDNDEMKDSTPTEDSPSSPFSLSSSPSTSKSKSPSKDFQNLFGDNDEMKDSTPTEDSPSSTSQSKSPSKDFQNLFGEDLQEDEIKDVSPSSPFSMSSLSPPSSPLPSMEYEPDKKLDNSSESGKAEDLNLVNQQFIRKATRSVANVLPVQERKISPMKRDNKREKSKAEPVKYSTRLQSKQLAKAAAVEQINCNVDKILENSKVVGEPKRRVAHQRTIRPVKNIENIPIIRATRSSCKRKMNDEEDECRRPTKYFQKSATFCGRRKSNVEENCPKKPNLKENACVMEEVIDKPSEVIKPKLFVKQNLIDHAENDNYNIIHNMRVDENDADDDDNSENELIIDESPASPSISTSETRPNESPANSNELILENFEFPDDGNGENKQTIDDSPASPTESPAEIFDFPASPCQEDLDSEPPKPPIVIPLELDEKYRSKKSQNPQSTNFMSLLINSTMPRKKQKVEKSDTTKATYLSILKQYMNKMVEDGAEEANGTELILKLVDSNADCVNLAKAIVDYTRQELPFNNEKECELLKRLWQLVSDLQDKNAEFCCELRCEIESLIFNVKCPDKIFLAELINLIRLDLLCENVAQNLQHAARLMIAKCLYYHNVRAMPMIYTILCEHPTVLPHRDSKSPDIHDPMVLVIKHALMCHTYDMNNKELKHRELLSKLRFEYHFEPYQPNRDAVLSKLTELIRTGENIEDIPYAFAVFCKRLHQTCVCNLVLTSTLVPLASEWYKEPTSCPERISVLLECISLVVKPLPPKTDVSVFLSLFERFFYLPHQIVREAAVRAILRLQRFGFDKCINSLWQFRPLDGTEIDIITLAMLRTFISRRPMKFWKQVASDAYF